MAVTLMVREWTSESDDMVTCCILLWIHREWNRGQRSPTEVHSSRTEGISSTLDLTNALMGKNRLLTAVSILSDCKISLTKEISINKRKSITLKFI